MSSLEQQLEEAQARVEQLRRAIAAGPCATNGHDWQGEGGANAACELDGHCDCSVPVNVCSKCSACDYGQNAEAERIRQECRQRRCTCQSGYHQPEGAQLRANDCPIHGIDDEACGDPDEEESA